MSAGIYSITCVETGKVYIGSSKKLTRRIREHMDELKSGLHNNKDLQSDYDTWGNHCFIIKILEIIEPTDFKKCRHVREQHHLDIAVSSGKGVYNRLLTIGAFPELTEEGRIKIIELNKRRTFSAETRAKMSYAKRNISAETRAKMSASKKNMSAETRAKIGELSRNRSAETLAKMSASAKQRVSTPEGRAKLIKASHSRRPDLHPETFAHDTTSTSDVIDLTIYMETHSSD